MPKRSGKTVKNIHIYCAYDYNSGTAWFDNISLRQEPVQTYRYDGKGNVTAATQTGTGTENAQYDSNGVDLLQDVYKRQLLRLPYNSDADTIMSECRS